MIKEAIIKLAKKQDLTYTEAEAVMNEIMSGGATPVQMASYLTALSMKGETIDEITASAAGMRAHGVRLLHEMDVLEIVGTGGDGSNSFNISTTSSLVIAAGGVPGGKTRQPGSVLQVRRSRRARGTRREDHDLTGEEQRASGKDRYLFPVCTEVSRGDAVCGSGAQGTRYPHGV